MAKTAFVITPNVTLGDCPEDPGQVVEVWETISYLGMARVIRAGACTECIVMLKRSLKKKGVKIIDKRGARLN